MDLTPARIEVEVDGRVWVAAPDVGPVAVGPLEVSIGRDGRATSWTVANRADEAVALRSVAVVHRVGDVRGPLRMYRQGYQSWSRSGVATFGIDHDPTATPGVLEFVQGVHHADPRAARPGELRSEWVTVLQDDEGPWLAGFLSGVDHDGTWRLRRGEPGAPPGGGEREEVELWAEAFVGGAVLAPGEARDLHPFTVGEGGEGRSASELLAGWAAAAGAANRARVSAPYQVGWCSWYHYFHGITEEALRANLARAAEWPFDVFQLDDGYQAAIGDWLSTDDTFPSTIDQLATAIAAEGRRPGIWIAPFIAAPDSEVARLHPEWVARHTDGSPLYGMVNPEWGGGEGGLMYALDTTHPEVLDHLASVASDLVDAGFTYLKLDFTFAPSFPGRWVDPSRTPAQRVRAGYEAIRRGAGEDTFLLACGAPLSQVVGVVDGNRIGSDVDPSWELRPERDHLPGYGTNQPSTRNAYANTVTRAFMHRQLWLNDPDCLMLRTEETAMSAEAVATWAHAVGVSGGMALVSDDLALLGPEARLLLDDVVAIGRVVDDAARAGAVPVSADLMDHEIPAKLAAAGYELVVDPADGTSTLRRPA
jgi:alpha-galactosidase